MRSFGCILTCLTHQNYSPVEQWWDAISWDDTVALQSRASWIRNLVFQHTRRPQNANISSKLPLLLRWGGRADVQKWLFPVEQPRLLKLNLSLLYLQLFCCKPSNLMSKKHGGFQPAKSLWWHERQQATCLCSLLLKGCWQVYVLLCLLNFSEWRWHALICSLLRDSGQNLDGNTGEPWHFGQSSVDTTPLNTNKMTLSYFLYLYRSCNPHSHFT